MDEYGTLGQSETQNRNKDSLRGIHRDQVRTAKALIRSNVFRNIKDNKKSFYR